MTDDTLARLREWLEQERAKEWDAKESAHSRQSAGFHNGRLMVYNEVLKWLAAHAPEDNPS